MYRRLSSLRSILQVQPDSEIGSRRKVFCLSSECRESFSRPDSLLYITTNDNAAKISRWSGGIRYARPCKQEHDNEPTESSRDADRSASTDQSSQSSNPQTRSILATLNGQR